MSDTHPVLLTTLSDDEFDRRGGMSVTGLPHGGSDDAGRAADMTTIQIEAEISPDQLLRAVEHLPPREFISFVVHLLALRVAPGAVSQSSGDSVDTGD